MCQLNIRDELCLIKGSGHQWDVFVEPICVDRLGAEQETELFLRGDEFLGNALSICAKLVHFDAGSDHIRLGDGPRFESGFRDTERLRSNRDEFVDELELRVKLQHSGMEFSNLAKDFAPNAFDISKLRGFLSVGGGHRCTEPVPDDNRLRYAQDRI